MNKCSTCKFEQPNCPFVMKKERRLFIGEQCTEWTEFNIANIKEELKSLKQKVEWLDGILKHTNHYPQEIR